MASRTNLRSSRGAVLVETVIILPLVLVVLLILLWFGVMQNAKASLTQAVNNAVRLALTRSVLTTQASPILGTVDAWHNGESDDQSVNNILFSYPPDPNDPLAALNQKVAEMFDESGNGQELKDLPLTYAYSMAYLNQALQLSIGPSVRFPCEPIDAAGVVREGCVNCSFLRPADGALLPMEVNDPFPLDALGIECRMMPGSPLIRPISGMLRVITGGGYQGTVITRGKYYAPPPD